MKLAFFSNFLNHHQIPFCNEMTRLLGENNFYFIASMPTPEVQLTLGYDDCNNMFPYVIRSYENAYLLDFSKELFLNCDIVIGGSWYDYHLRAKSNKLTFNYSERLFKLSFNPIKEYRFLLHLLKSHTLLRNKNFYLLCAGAYVAKDYSSIWAYPHKKLKWGYFTEVFEYDIEAVLASKRKKKVELLWVGRFIDWKHPEQAVLLMNKLVLAGFEVHLSFVGTGVMEYELKEMVKELKLQNKITFLGALPQAEVREIMLLANIFLFTSDRQEGWGAVLNEAMNSGCAPVACREIGAVPFLIDDGNNGFIYDNINQNELYVIVKKLLSDATFIENIGRNAYYTMIDRWSPKVAAERLLAISATILSGEFDENYFESDVCSKG